MLSRPGLSLYISGMETRAGMVAIVGMPNAGKSSLLNQFLESKLSIVTAAAQTTREQVVGIDTREGVQMVFLDTPGIVDPAYLLHHAMIGIIERTIIDADIILFLLDGTREQPTIPEEVEKLLRAATERLVVVMNKADLIGESTVDCYSDWSVKHFGIPVVPVSALTGRGIGELRSIIANKLPVSPFLYPDDDISTQSVRFFVSELVRESVFELYREEIPYSTAVRVEEYREGEDPIYIRAVIYVERASQKGILIGRKGEAIRQLGSAARTKIEEFVGARVYLDLWIKVLPKWRKSALELTRLGFSIPDDRGK